MHVKMKNNLKSKPPVAKTSQSGTDSHVYVNKLAASPPSSGGIGSACPAAAWQKRINQVETK
jgi:hypothetical protein